MDMKALRKAIDLPLLFVYIALVSIGIIIIFSATYHADTIGLNHLYRKQALLFMMGLSLCLLIMTIPFKVIYVIAPVLYIAALVILLFTLLMSGSSFVDDRWLVLGGLRGQPSEFAKIATLLMLARYLGEPSVSFRQMRHYTIPIGIVLLPVLFIARQPDLGTSLVFLALLFPLFYWAGVRNTMLLFFAFPFINVITSFNWIAWTVFMLVVMGALFISRPTLYATLTIFLGNLFVGIITPFLWNQLHGYQKQRILTFLNPENDPLGSGYQIIQSKVAVGSGGVWGKGFLQGTQTKLAFLPEQHTDFIFSVLAEEFGFIGVSVVMALLFYIVYRIIRIAAMAHNRFASLVCIGIATVILFHTTVNLGMVVGLMPVTGLPLPFLSYGGSSLISFSLMIGLVLGVAVRKYEY